MLTFGLLVALFFVILFSIVLERVIRNPFIVAGITAIIALIVFALFTDALTAVFLIWIPIYIIVSFIAAYLSDYYRRRRNNHGNHDNEDCF